MQILIRVRGSIEDESKLTAITAGGGFIGGTIVTSSGNSGSGGRSSSLDRVKNTSPVNILATDLEPGDTDSRPLPGATRPRAERLALSRESPWRLMTSAAKPRAEWAEGG